MAHRGERPASGNSIQMAITAASSRPTVSRSTSCGAYPQLPPPSPNSMTWKSSTTTGDGADCNVSSTVIGTVARTPEASTYSSVTPGSTPRIQLTKPVPGVATATDGSRVLHTYGP